MKTSFHPRKKRMPQPGGIGPSGKPKWTEATLAATAAPGKPVGLGIQGAIAANEAEIAREEARTTAAKELQPEPPNPET